MLNMLTMKFGGTSVGSPEAIGLARQIVQEALQGQARQVAVVVSAMGGVTNMLQAAVEAAALNRLDEVQQIKAALRHKHQAAAAALLPPPQAEQVLTEIEPLIEDLVRFCESIAVLGEATPRALDYTMGLGERMSVRLVAAAFCEGGLAAEWIEATELIRTDDRFQDAAPLMDISKRQVQARLTGLLQTGKVPVITGYIGATEAGLTTTLGRGGSDYSAAILAACLDSDELWIWTDVDGVMSADPRVVPGAVTLAEASYREVSEMAYFGAKVLHPKTIRPLRPTGTPIRVKNTFNHSHPGTLIRPEVTASGQPLKAVTAIQHVGMITMEGRGFQGIPGVAGRTFSAVAHTDTSILMISQSSSEQSIFFVVPENRAAEVVSVIEAEFAAEIARGDIDAVNILYDYCIVTIVGSGMRNTPGVSARIFNALGAASINVVASAHGSSDCSISLAIAKRQLNEALQAIHDQAVMG